jgi:hypothetical protein
VLFTLTCGSPKVPQAICPDAFILVPATSRR